jgi:hypothetical protein
MAKKKAPEEPELEQGYIDPELAPVKIRAVTDACRIYYKTMMERVELSKAEHEAKDNLINVMLANDIHFYEYDGKIVVLVDLKNVKIRKKKEESPDFGGDSE